MLRSLAAFPILVGACSSYHPDDGIHPSTPAVARFEMTTRERTFEGCIAGSEGCTYIRFDYPVIVDAPEGTAVEAITATIHSFLSQALQEDDERSGIDRILDDFIESYRAFRTREPRSEESWYLERKAFVLENRPNLLSLSLSEHALLEDEESVATIEFTNIDPRTGGTLTLSEILQEGALEGLTSLAEARFREVRLIPEGTSLEAAGFTFEEGTFRLTDNFSLSEKGITFYYNPAEIAPQDEGATEVILTTEEIREFLSPEFLRDPPA